GRVVIDERDLLALELVEPAFLLCDVLQENVGGRPIGAEQREVPLEYRAVARLRAAVAHGNERNLVVRRLFRERKGDAGREREYIGRAGWAFALQPLVALHAAVGGITGIAFLKRDLDAVDAAVALVDEVVIVGDAVRDGDTVGRIGAGPIHQLGMNCSFCARDGVASAATPTRDASAIPTRFPFIGSSIDTRKGVGAAGGSRISPLGWRKSSDLQQLGSVFAAAKHTAGRKRTRGPECL